LSLVAYVIHKISLESLIKSFTEINLLWVAAAGFLWLVQLVLSTIRWQIVAREQGMDFTFGRYFKLYYVACLIGLVMPATIGTDAVRAKLLSRTENVTLGHAFRSVVKDRLLSTIAMVIVVIASLPFLYILIDDTTAKNGLLVAILGLTGGVIGILFGEKLWAPIPWIGKHLSLMSLETRALLKNKPVAIKVISLGVAIQVLVSLQFWCLGLGVHLDAAGYAYLVLLPAISILTMLPVTINGWGMRETALYKGFALIGIVSPLAVTLSILFGLLTTVMNLGAAPLLLHLSLGQVIAPDQDDIPVTTSDAR